MEIWDLHCHLSGVPGRTPEERMARLVAAADRMGISRLCVYMGMKWSHDPSPEDFRKQNDEVLQALSHYHDRAFGFVYVNPKHVKESLAEIDRCVRDGPMVGVKLWVARRADNKEVDAIVVRATELKALIFQHTWIKATGNLPGESTPMELAALAARHPKAAIICGHTGGDWEQGIRAVRAQKHVAVDLAGGDPVAGVTEMAVRELGAERVIYGSDAGGRSFASQLAKVHGADVPDAAKTLILAGNLKRLLGPILKAKGVRPVTDRLIDVNVNLSRWPARRIRCDETKDLVAKLKSHGVVEAWAGSFDGLLHKDVAAVNARLIEECKAHTDVRLAPFGSVNPMLPDWEEDLRRCVEVHRMPGVRLHPNYHGYKLDHPAFAKLLALAAEKRLIVALALLMEDERMMHPLLRVPNVDPAPLAALVGKTPGLRLVLLNALGILKGDARLTLLRSGDVSVDVGTLEIVNGVANLLDEVPQERVLFGSHAPLFYFESALFKLKESPLTAAQLRALREENARRLLPAA